MNLKLSIPLAIAFSGILISGSVIYKAGLDSNKQISANLSGSTREESTYNKFEELVAPEAGVILSASWGDLGQKLIASGAIDKKKFIALYSNRGEYSKEYEALLTGSNNGKLKITQDNAGYLLNLLWALGMSSRNPILDTGEMTDPKYGGAENFASTAGWVLAKGDPMNHYSMHSYFSLTNEEQSRVEEVSKNIYRPCCGNSTHFPDCNHGMAMLGLLELMASQGASETEMYDAALAVNGFWFPDTYVTVAAFLKNKGLEWSSVVAKDLLGFNVSSVYGFREISKEVSVPSSNQGSGGCDVSGGAVKAPQKQSVSCGI